MQKKKNKNYESLMEKYENILRQEAEKDGVILTCCFYGATWKEFPRPKMFSIAGAK